MITHVSALRINTPGGLTSSTGRTRTPGTEAIPTLTPPHKAQLSKIIAVSWIGDVDNVQDVGAVLDWDEL